MAPAALQLGVPAQRSSRPVSFATEKSQLSLPLAMDVEHLQGMEPEAPSEASRAGGTKRPPWETSGAGGQARRGHAPGLSLLIQALASGPSRVSTRRPAPRSPTHICVTCLT